VDPALRIGSIVALPVRAVFHLSHVELTPELRPPGAPASRDKSRSDGPEAYESATRSRCGPPLRSGLGLRLGLRAQSWRVAAQIRTFISATKSAELQGLCEVARPGLEPGTPRFSGSRGRPVPAAKHLQIAGFEAAMPRRDTGGCGRLRAGLGLQGGLEVPNDPRSTTSWVRSTSSSWRDGRERCRVARSSYWPPWGRSSRG
jgi:hypothetical protein